MANLSLSPKAGTPTSPSSGFPNTLSPKRIPALSLPFKSMPDCSAPNKGSLQQTRAAAAACIPAAESSSLYEILGVSRNVETREIKAAYRQLARLVHPDVAPPDQKEESTKAFLQLQTAYQVLSDPENRAKYDLEILGTQHGQISYVYGCGHGSSNGYNNFKGSSQGFSGYGVDSFAGSSYSSPSSYASMQSQFRGKSWETDQCW